MSPFLGAALLVLLFGVTTLVADALPRRWRFIPIVLLGLLLAATFMELVRFDHGHGRALFWLGHLAAPAFVVLSLAYRFWRFSRGSRKRLRHLERATNVAFLIVLGVWAGVSLRVGDIADSEAVGERLEASWTTSPPAENAWTEERTELGILAPPFYWYGRDARGRRIVAFPKGGGEWHVKAVGKPGWRTLDHDPAVAVHEPEPTR